MLAAVDERWSGELAVDDLGEEVATGAAVVVGGNLGLSFRDAVHERAGVDLAVRVRVRSAHRGAAVLEDQDVRDAVESAAACARAR